jgi:hypothetical protein
MISDKLSKAGWTWGCVATIDSNGRTIFVADAHRDDGKRYVVHADEKLSAFLELERPSNFGALGALRWAKSARSPTTYVRAIIL